MLVTGASHNYRGNCDHNNILREGLMLMTIIYELIVAFFSVLFLWNLFTVKDLGKQISCCIVLVPFLLRLFMIR